MRILQGMEQPDEGDVIVNDAPVRLANPADAFGAASGWSIRNSCWWRISPCSKTLSSGAEPVSARRAHRPQGRAMRRPKLAAAQAGVKLDWDIRVAQAPVHRRQILEILRLLYRGADVLILDEPTSVLAPQQVRDLLALLRRLRDEGRTIIFISHKLDEVLAVADDITVLRAGRVAGAVQAQPDLGREARRDDGRRGDRIPTPRRACARRPRSRALAVHGLAALDTRGVMRLDGIDLAIRPGEVVGIAGRWRQRAGRTGGRHRRADPAEPGQGDARTGADITSWPIAARREAGLGYISADRAREGLCLSATIADNVIAGRHRAAPFERMGVLRPSLIAAHVASGA